jgi:hypothetical protein
MNSRKTHGGMSIADVAQLLLSSVADWGSAFAQAMA